MFAFILDHKGGYGYVVQVPKDILSDEFLEYVNSHYGTDFRESEVNYMYPYQGTIEYK